MATIGRPNARSDGRPSRDWEKVGGGLLVGAALVAAVTILILLEACRPCPRDPDTYCCQNPNHRPRQVTAIILDTTNRIGPISRADILGSLDELVDASQPEEEVIILHPPRSTAQIAEPQVMVCYRSKPNPLFENVGVAEEMRKAFRDRLKERFRQLIDSEEAKISPIMETIQAASVTLFARNEYAGIPKRLVLVSDLMQNSEHLNLYGHSLDYSMFSGTPGSVALGTDLDEVVIDVYLVQRSVHPQVMRLIEFWTKWIEDQRGMLVSVSKIDGSN